MKRGEIHCHHVELSSTHAHTANQHLTTSEPSVRIAGHCYHQTQKNMQQTKKKYDDPDIQDVNPELINYAKEIGFLRGPFNLYLAGTITYQEALETMVLIMTREYRQVMSRIVKKPIKQRVDHSDLISLPPEIPNPLALPSHDRGTETEVNNQAG